MAGPARLGLGSQSLQRHGHWVRLGSLGKSSRVGPGALLQTTQASQPLLQGELRDWGPSRHLPWPEGNLARCLSSFCHYFLCAGMSGVQQRRGHVALCPGAPGLEGTRPSQVLRATIK